MAEVTRTLCAVAGPARDARYDLSMSFRSPAIAAAAVILLALTGCSSPTPVTDDAWYEEPVHYTAAEQHMMSLGNSIDGMWGTTTEPEMWLSIQRQNCEVARSLAGAEPTSVSWYVPVDEPTSAILDADSIIGASAAASLVTGCFDLIDSSWNWPSFWGFIRAQNAVSGGGSRVQCDDGTWSDAGGEQGACSWHGGLED